MPIYAYRCESCGHAQDVLQKISDPVLTHCPACGTESYKKQVTAAGFQLKGTGWYVTDFRGGSTAAGAAGGVVAGDASGSAKEAAPAPAPASDSGSTDSAPAAGPTTSGSAPSDS